MIDLFAPPTEEELVERKRTRVECWHVFEERPLSIVAASMYWTCEKCGMYAARLPLEYAKIGDTWISSLPLQPMKLPNATGTE